MSSSFSKVAFFLCDLQENFRPVIHQFPALIHVAQRMIKASEILSIPLICTEQNPKKLGSLVLELNLPTAINENENENGQGFSGSELKQVYSKTKFSMCTTPIMKWLKEKDIREIALFGIEGHICIQQTALDLLKNNFKLYLLVDGTSSRHYYDKKIALKRMHSEGAILTTSESFLFELLVDASHEKFREISKLVKETDSSIWRYIEKT